ncbi:UNVERIFIED_CONTAM: hypothetical protein Sradi_3601300 [Sesamum radiatum]|uniref:Uncharacterized protein n=1 Tax=Sesamum radiatum TaxID=300843 RepID=A0AAW2QI39_SESRA
MDSRIKFGLGGVMILEIELAKQMVSTPTPNYRTLNFRRGWCLRLHGVLDERTVPLPAESGLPRSSPGTRNPSRTEVVVFIILHGGHVFTLELVWRPTWGLRGGKPCSGPSPVGS